MKLGILTFHCAHNYGAVLQCYALQEYLKSLGHEVYVIDYRPDYLVDFYKKYKREYWFEGTNKLKAIIRESIRIPYRGVRYKAFQRFIDSHLHLYPYQETDNFSDFDAIFLGSDQIWNAKITGKKFDLVFFGEGTTCKIIVYAASNKNFSLTAEEEGFYKKVLSKLDYIGVRETTLQQLLQPLTEKKVHLNVDPTLLAGDMLFKSLDISQGFKHKYVLIYEITSHKWVHEMAKKFALSNNYKIVELNSRILPTRLSERDQTASPEKWVRYIKHAEMVVTTSFHGVAVSILLEKKFYYVRQHNPNDFRIESLLNQLNLQDRMIEPNEIIKDASIDFASVTKKLEQIRNDSVKYITESLRDN